MRRTPTFPSGGLNWLTIMAEKEPKLERARAASPKDASGLTDREMVPLRVTAKFAKEVVP